MPHSPAQPDVRFSPALQPQQVPRRVGDPAGRRSFLARHKVATAITAVVAGGAGALVALAVHSTGYVARHVDLNDGGVWVVSDKDGLFGRLNKPAGVLDAALNPPGTAQSTYSLDVGQDGSSVVAWDRGAGRLYPVDPVAGKVLSDQGVAVSSAEQVAVGGGTVAVLDPRTGRVWAQRFDPGSGLTALSSLAPTVKPVARFGAAAGNAGASGADALAVGTDGTVYAASALGETLTVHPSGSRFGAARSGTLTQNLRSVQVTAVGSSMVVVDAVAGEVYLPGGQSGQFTPDASAKVQAPSTAGSSVVVATSQKLISFPLDGSAQNGVVLKTNATGAPAAPTWLGDCVHAAWAGQPGLYARSCDGATATAIPLAGLKRLVQPVFRVNRDEILLNDLATGGVYDLDTHAEVDDWSAAKPPPVVRRSTKAKNDDTTSATRDLPPAPKDDTLGARPGRTTVLHVLDNDSDPQGSILAITGVSGDGDPDAPIAVAPDGQSVEITLPATQAHDEHFDYTVDNGHGRTGTASVDVQVREPGQNSAPHLRAGYQQPTFSVTAGGTLDLPVLDDWRDFDGDPLVVTRATVGAGTITTTPDGRIDYLAPSVGGSQKIVYYVSDGIASPVRQVVPVTVLGANDPKTAAPIAEPDIARGQVGTPIVVKPLANDLPGADPSNPDAQLQLAGTVSTPAGTTVDTDLASGTVTLTASRQGTYLLNYTAAYGNASYGHSVIRVDVTNPPSTAQPPVAVPDTGVLYGQSAATIDVVANDFDPAGGVLVVQHAQPVTDDGQLQVAIVDGRFLRVQARQAQLTPATQTVRYTITDGLTDPVSGELTVTQEPPPTDDTPIAVDDYVTVRSGDSALVPVLDNDLDPAGATLSLLDDVPGAPAPGQLSVSSATDVRIAAPGTAFVSGKNVRYIAPTVTRQTAVTVAYVAQNPNGLRGAGTIHVTITPPVSRTNPDRAPGAQDVDSRVVSGDTIAITVPTTGVDPDGDSTTVVAITSAPKLGRVVSFGATSITYEAFPTESGTDRFGYEIADAYGKTSQATVSIGIAQASDPQPPVAVDDTVTAAPGRKIRVDVLGNDVIAPDDSVSIGNLRRTNGQLPAGVTLVKAAGPIEVTAPAVNGQSLVFRYALQDGAGDPSAATVTVRSRAGYVPPPTVTDATAIPKPGAATATVNLLAHASDPQGLVLHVAKVFDSGAIVSGGAVRVPLLARAQSIPFEVANSQGGSAAAVLHVPARGTGLPYGRANQLITLARGGSTTVDIDSYVIDPLGRAVRLTTTNQLFTAPSGGLRLSSPDPIHLTLTSTGSYAGPAAISFQVTDGRSLADLRGQLALITVEVQVGAPTPVIRCPSAPVGVVEGGDTRDLDITALCHVWAPNRSQLDQLRYTASWRKEPSDVQLLGSGGHTIGLRAGGAARPGATGILTIRVAGTGARAATPSTVAVVVNPIGKPSVAPVTIDGLRAGSTATRDLAGYVDSPLSDPHVTVVRVDQVSGQRSKVSWHGSTVSITPGNSTHGAMEYSVVVSDIADTARRARQVTGTISLDVLNVPDAPGPPQAGRTTLSQTVVLSWPTPPANGAQIDGYQVQWPGGSQQCAASPCRITGLTNGRKYAFTVRAHNAVGYSKASPALHPAAVPDKLPAAVANLTASNPQDHTLTLSWTPVRNGSSAVTSYQVHWSGGGSKVVTAPQHSAQITGLDNDNPYTFDVVAVNELGDGPTASTQGQSAGTPGTPGNVRVAYADAAGTTQRAVTVTWSAVDPNGAGSPRYTVTRNGTAICTEVTATSCNDTPATGQTYTYTVTARNDAGHRSGAGSAQFTVEGTPDAPTDVTATHTANNGELAVTWTNPNSHGTGSTINCTLSGGGSCGSWPGGAPGTTGSSTIHELDNADYTVMLSDSNDHYTGPAATAQPAPAHTDGPANPPGNGKCSLSGDSIVVTWTQPAAINGYAVNKYTVHIDNADHTVTTTRYSKAEPEDGESRTVTVTSIDSRNESGNNFSVLCQDHAKPAPPQPQPAVTVHPGDYSTSLAGCSGGCHYVAITLSNFTPGSKVSFSRTWTPATDESPESHAPVTIGSDGTWSGTDGYYGGGDSGGHGPGTVTISVPGGPSDACYADWHDPNVHSCS